VRLFTSSGDGVSSDAFYVYASCVCGAFYRLFYFAAALSAAFLSAAKKFLMTEY
jgi:hypothetical protein